MTEQSRRAFVQTIDALWTNIPWDAVSQRLGTVSKT